MSEKPEPEKPIQDAEPCPPDERGERPTDPNELAKWIVEQSVGDHPSPTADSEATDNAEEKRPASDRNSTSHLNSSG